MKTTDAEIIDDLTRQLADERNEAASLRANCDAQQQAIAHLTRQLEAALKEIARLRKALENIAKQHLESEMEEEEDVDGADYRGAYDCIVKVARAALEAK